VNVPAGYAGDLKVDTVSGDIKTGKLVTKQFELKSVSGDLQAERIISSNAELETTSGNINIDNMTGDLIFEIISGDIRVSYPVFADRITEKTTSGEVYLKFAKNADFLLEAETVSGNVSCEFPLKVAGAEGIKGLKGTVGNGTNKFFVKSVSGNINIIQ